MTEQKSKSGRGGNRPRAGRKPNSINRKTAIRQALKSLISIKQSSRVNSPSRAHELHRRKASS